MLPTLFALLALPGFTGSAPHLDAFVRTLLLQQIECFDVHTLLHRMHQEDALSELNDKVVRVRRRHFIPAVSLHGFINDNASASFPNTAQQAPTGSVRSGAGVEVRLTFVLRDTVYDEHEAMLRREYQHQAQSDREQRLAIAKASHRLRALHSELTRYDLLDPRWFEAFDDAQQRWLELDVLTAGGCGLSQQPTTDARPSRPP